MHSTLSYYPGAAGESGLPLLLFYIEKLRGREGSLPRSSNSELGWEKKTEVLRSHPSHFLSAQMH